MKIKLTTIALFMLMSLCVWAIPARKGGKNVTLKDGSTMTIYQHGDEHFHWMTNEKGEWIEHNATGDWVIVPSLTKDEIAARRAAAPRNRIAQKQQASKLNIAPRGLIILVNFTDVAFETDKAEMDSMLTGQHYTRDYSYTYNKYQYHITSEGSARQYFYDASFGQYNPQFDVIGPVTVSQNVAAYGGNTPSGSDKLPEKMIYEACKLVDDSVDFSLYDNDDDGVVDFVYVYYAGFGEADGGGNNTIWPHQYYLTQYRYLVLDNKQIDRYACSNELSFYTKLHDGIGPFCHEFSHVLGLPDLYSTEYTNHRTCVDWDILDYGPYNNDGNTPPTYSAYERFFMGWLTPRVLTESEMVTLHELQTHNEALLISTTGAHNLIGNDPNPTTFYLLENRQQTKWDEYLAGHGMMLTKVAYSTRTWQNNTVNNKAKNMGVDIIEADGIAADYSDYGSNINYWGKPTDLFPAGAIEYLEIVDYPIKDIEEKDGVITFNFKDAIPSNTENIRGNYEVLAIYNILGQAMSTKDIQTLSEGTYIVKTNKGTKKIIIR